MLTEDEEDIIARHGNAMLSKIVFELQLIFDKENYKTIADRYEKYEGTKPSCLDELVDWFFENHDTDGKSWVAKTRMHH